MVGEIREGFLEEGNRGTSLGLPGIWEGLSWWGAGNGNASLLLSGVSEGAFQTLPGQRPQVLACRPPKGNCKKVMTYSGLAMCQALFCISFMNTS